MALIEQAVFTSAETDRSAGYQVVAQSPGICEADARELVVWCPSHDALLELGPDAVSYNFHPLPSGTYCVSRTTHAGWEYSGRGGHRVYTQCMIVSPEVLKRFANNPFALVRAALAGGMLEVHQQIPGRLEPFELAGGAAPVDQNLLPRLAVRPGPQQLAILIQAALDSACLAVAGSPSAAELIAGLFSCLPPECRNEFSFSTGLKFSSRRPFRIVALPDDPAEQRWVAHQHNVTALELADGPSAESMPIDGWARLIERVLTTGRTSFLTTQLSKRRFQLASDDLSALGLQLLEELDACEFRGDQPRDDWAEKGNWLLLPSDRSCDYKKPDAKIDNPSTSAPAGQAGIGSEGLTHAHAAHHRFEKSPEAVATVDLKATAPSKVLASNAPEILEKLEHLDDVVYEAISGQATALEQLFTLWPEVLGELGEDLVAESREQYLRYTLLIWEACFDTGNIRNPSHALQALDVLCVLFKEG